MTDETEERAPSTETVWPEATRALARDPAFGALVRRVGPVRLAPATEAHFPYLARVVVYQQLAGRAAATIHERFVRAVGGAVTPDAILAASEEDLRGAGLSRNKTVSLLDLAGKVAGGEVRLDGIEALDDDEILERLVEVRGIGPWSARMFLLFQLRRPDVWPVGDLGVRTGWARVHRLDETPVARELEPLGEPYRPWRSAVAWYCWRAVDTLTPAG